MNDRCKSWWERNASVVSGISNIATALAAICVAITLLVSVSHLNVARKQLENTALSLRASTAFLISQEGREIAKLLRKDLKKNKGFGFSFFHTAWYQHHIGALDSDLWTPIEAEICAFVRDVDAKSFFSGKRRSMYNIDFVNYIENRSTTCNK